jgi:selT/selW/selH-like putative selenoprotein
LEARLRDELGIVAELIGGTKGVFDVVADGELVFSKHAEGRFPEDQEIVDALRARIG